MDDKLPQLFWLGFVHFILGALLGILGTTFPDLQCLFKADLDEVSSLVLAFGLTTPVACLLFPIMNRKCNIYLLMATMIVLYCAGVATIAATPFIEVAFVASGAAGFAFGAANTGMLHMSNVLFPENAYAFHVIASSGSAGSFLSPFFAMPFLGRLTGNTTMLPQNTTDRQTQNISAHKTFETNFQGMARKRQLGISQNTSTSLPSYCETHSSTVYYLYIVIGLLGVPLIFAFCWYYLRGYILITCSQTLNDGYAHMNTKKNKSRYEIVFILLVTTSFSLVYGLVYTYGTYLTTVGLEGPLHLCIQKMEVLTSLLWLHVFLGRLSCTVLSAYFRQTVILYSCFTGEIVAMILLTAFGKSEVFLWIGTLLLGFCSGPVLAALMAWCREYIALTPRVLGMSTLADSFGLTFLPYLSGQLISAYGVQSHNYYCFTLALLQLALFCGIHGLGVIMKYNSEITHDIEKIANTIQTSDVNDKLSQRAD